MGERGPRHFGPLGGLDRLVAGKCYMAELGAQVLDGLAGLAKLALGRLMPGPLGPHQGLRRLNLLGGRRRATALCLPLGRAAARYHHHRHLAVAHEAPLLAIGAIAVDRRTRKRRGRGGTDFAGSFGSNTLQGTPHVGFGLVVGLSLGIPGPNLIVCHYIPDPMVHGRHSAALLCMRLCCSYGANLRESHTPQLTIKEQRNSLVRKPIFYSTGKNRQKVRFHRRSSQLCPESRHDPPAARREIPMEIATVRHRSCRGRRVAARLMSYAVVDKPAAQRHERGRKPC